MDKYCRLCGKEEENLSNIFPHDESQTARTAIEIQKILSIDVRKNDRLPVTICYICRNELRRTADFVERAHQAQNHLKRLLEISISTKSDDSNNGSVSGAGQNLENQSPVNEINFVSVDHKNQLLVENDVESRDSSIFTPVSTALESGDSEVDPVLDNDASSVSHTNELSNQRSIDGLLKSLLESESNNPKGTKDCDINANSDLTRSNNLDDVQSSDGDAEQNPCKLSVRKLNQYYCDLCDVRVYFDRYDDFETHMAAHKKTRSRQCKLCDIVFPMRKDLAAHVKTTHAEDRYRCSLCNFACSRKGALTLHKNNIHMKLVGCKLCDFKTNTKPQLVLHVRNRHTEVKPDFVCEICGKVFKTQVAMTTHRGYKHFPVPKQCPRCGIMSPHAIAYSRHKLNCVDHRRYYCDSCGSAFFTKYRLREHMHKHLNVRPYACTICAKAFFSRHRLSIHMNVHCGPRFQCDVCGRGFNRKDNMRNHRKTQHSSQLAQLEASK